MMSSEEPKLPPMRPDLWSAPIWSIEDLAHALRLDSWAAAQKWGRRLEKECPGVRLPKLGTLVRFDARKVRDHLGIA